MKFKTYFAAASILAALGGARVEAQMSITTIGANDAVSCYLNAENQLSRDIAPCDRALRAGNLTPVDRKKTLVNRGVIHNRNGEIGAAIDDFNAALEIDAALAEAFLNRGNSHILAGRPQAALDDYQRALALGLSKPWVAWYNIGLAHERMKEPEKARDAYRKALALNPSFAPAQRKLADREQDRK